MTAEEDIVWAYIKTFRSGGLISGIQEGIRLDSGFPGTQSEVSN